MCFLFVGLNSVRVVEFVLHKWHCCRVRQALLQRAAISVREISPSRRSRSRKLICAHLAIPLLLNKADRQDEQGKRPPWLFTDCSIEVCSSRKTFVCLLRYMRRSYVLLGLSTERTREPS